MKTKLQPIPTAQLLLACLLCLLPALTRAEIPTQAWVQRYNGPANAGDGARVVVVDSGNNVIVTGSSTGSGSRDDYLTIKYSSTGVPLWTNRYNGPGNSYDVAFAMALDGSNNVIVTGYSDGSESSHDFATIKYSSAGMPLWTNLYNGPVNGYDIAYAVAVDGSNNVIVTGYSQTALVSYSYDYATIKYSSAGMPLWTNLYNGPGNGEDDAWALAVDSNNNVIVTGSSWGSGNSPDYATIKYSSTGVPLWTNSYNGSGNGYDNVHALAVDSSNNVIVTGDEWTSGNGGDYLTIKYSSAGVPLWTNTYNGPKNDNDEAYAMAVDGSNNVIVTGSSYGSGSADDYLTIKYSSAGMPLWTNRYNGPGNSYDRARAVAVDRSGNVTVTGHWYDNNTSTPTDYLTIQYSSAGVPLWTNTYNGPGNHYDEARAVAVDRTGNVIVTGGSYGSGSDYDFATIKYICVPLPVITGLNRTNGTFQMRVGEVSQPGTLVIETSTNLAGWSPVFTNTTTTNVLFYSDPDSSNHLWRFYRAFQFR